MTNGSPFTSTMLNQQRRELIIRELERICKEGEEKESKLRLDLKAENPSASPLRATERISMPIPAGPQDV